MAAHLRWKLSDPVASTELVFRPNPKEMSSPFPKRQITSSATTGGRAILHDAPFAPFELTFGGVTLDKVFYEGLREWFQTKPHLLVLSDHFGRRYEVYLSAFDPRPKRRVGRYWSHEYTCTVVVTGWPSLPTVGEVPL